LRWQSELMKAVAYNRPLPMPPSSIDFAKLKQQRSIKKKTYPIPDSDGSRGLSNVPTFYWKRIHLRIAYGIQLDRVRGHLRAL
jgi:hypothetical protein